jgi:putative endonuclease
MTVLVDHSQTGQVREVFRLSVPGLQNNAIAGGCFEMKGGFVYILASKSGVLYVGVTNRLRRRIIEHRLKLVDGFSARYNVDRLVYYEKFGNIRNAIVREKQIKGWLRAKKIALIESANPRWKDLAEELG